jgi:hypothetical protein
MRCVTTPFVLAAGRRVAYPLQSLTDRRYPETHSTMPRLYLEAVEPGSVCLGSEHGECKDRTEIANCNDNCGYRNSVYNIKIY